MLGWEVTLNRWVSQLGVRQSKHHGGQFNGNSTIKVLQGVNLLRRLLGRDLQKSNKLKLTLEAMEQLEAVRESCFGQTLDDDFEKEIRLLGQIWYKAGLSFTPKMHGLLVHTVQFLKFKMSQTGQKRGLGYWSEHASESVHYDFETFWQSGYKREMGHPDYKTQALKCISTYAARHI